MVRREGRAEEIAEATAEASPCCTVPAGESPVAVIAGEPRSRLAPEAQKPTGEAQCRKPSEGSKPLVEFIISRSAEVDRAVNAIGERHVNELKK